MDYNNLAFDTFIATKGTDYKLYFPAIHQKLGSYKTIDKIDGEARYSKFILHDIYLNISMDDIANSLQSNYCKITLPQTHHLRITNQAKYTTKNDETPKAASIVVIVFLGSHSLRSLRLNQLTVYKIYCCLDLYRVYNFSTFCSQCSHLDYSVSRCVVTPTCSHYGANYLTRYHKYASDKSPEGTEYTYVHFLYVNCYNIFHALTDPLCSAQLKTKEHAWRLDMSMEAKKVPL